MSKLKNISRFFLLFSALLLGVSFFVPVWEILMWAPQYPEGLQMKIWLHTITGDYKIISGLNHYIGMKHIEVSMFPEFDYLRIIVGFMIGAGVITALLNRRVFAIAYVVLILVAGAAGLVDFYLWGYDYGHNLDPSAPIIVPGMAYQPPLLGTKQLLNFTAYSGPDVGGYIFLVSGLISIGVVVYEVMISRKKYPAFAKTMTVIAVAFLALSCSPAPEPLRFGTDGCYSCKMILVDDKFGGEIVTRKGKVFKFDDTSCMLGFVRSGEVVPGDIAFELLIDYSQPGTLIDANSASLIRAGGIRTPMNGMVATFADEKVAQQFNEEWKGQQVSWKDLKLQD